MDPGVRSHGMKANPPGYLWSKYECLLTSGWWDILHLICFNVKLWSNSTNGMKLRKDKRTNIQTDARKDENYIPLGINAGGITRDIMLSRQWTTKVLIRLCRCTGWSALLLFKYGINRFSHFMKSFISFGMASPHITDASDFAIRIASFNPEANCLIWTLGRQDQKPITV